MRRTLGTGVRVLVLAPTRELATQIHDEVRGAQICQLRRTHADRS